MKPVCVASPAGTILLAALLFGCVSHATLPAEPEISREASTDIQTSITGVVLDSAGFPIAGARVRVKATETVTSTNLAGNFVLDGIVPDSGVFVTAWKDGYYIGGVANVLPGEPVIIVLTPYSFCDNDAYSWLPSAYQDEMGEEQGCARCHSDAAGLYSLPVDEWMLDAHSQTVINPRFLSMYFGTDLDGNQSPLTRYGYSRDYGKFPLPPDLSEPYYGPGYKLDFPTTAGNCAACHIPAAAVYAPYGTNPGQVTGAGAEGIPCDFCHKISDVRLDPETGLPFSNMPGVLSYSFLRPPEGYQLFIGPFDDVAPGEDTYSSLQQEGQFCAPCHFGDFWGVQVYNSYGEWLESPYSAYGGSTCQDCHMPHSGTDHFALPGQGGIERDPQTIFSHLMPGASSVDLLQNSVTMTGSASQDGDRITVTVEIVNDKTGHSVPTDSPLREMILLVQARDSEGMELVQVEGPVIPVYGGQGDPGAGYFAGLPGKIYAKILAELWTEISPSGAYWNPARIVSDNRIPATGSDTSIFVFKSNENSAAVDIQVTLLYRRAFIELMDEKDWNVADIVMEMQEIQIP